MSEKDPHLTGFTPEHQFPTSDIDTSGLGFYPVDDFYDFEGLLFEDDTWPPSEGREEASRESYFVNPEGTRLAREADRLPPLDMDDYNSWLKTLNPDKLEQLEEAKRGLLDQSALAKIVREKLKTSVPELYQARLPGYLEDRLKGTEYALGFNQSGASSAGEAAEYVAEAGGIDITNDGINFRFLMFDQGLNEEDADLQMSKAIESGYYDSSRLGRFVAAFPAEHREFLRPKARICRQVAIDPHLTPDDLTVSPDDQGTSINNKYIAGFIDGTGTFWANDGFYNDDQFKLVKLPESESH